MHTQEPMAADVHALFFGEADRPLYGVYHAPEASGRARATVVLCPPIGNEYQRAHRALAQLSARLARSGCAVLRFDWRGTGDSWGGLEEASIAGWVGDACAAGQEARARAGCERLFMVGLRLGASIASQAAASTAVDGLVVWEPLILGRAFFEDGEAEYRDLLTRLPGSAAPRSAPLTEMYGFDYPPSLAAEIRDLDLLRVTPSCRRRLALSTDAGDLARLRARWTTGGPLTDRLLGVPKFWRGDAEKSLVATEPIQAIVSWITEGLA